MPITSGKPPTNDSGPQLRIGTPAAGPPQPAHQAQPRRLQRLGGIWRAQGWRSRHMVGLGSW